MKTILGFADFTYCLSKWKYKTIDDAGIIAKTAELGMGCTQVDLALKLPEAEAAAERDKLRALAEEKNIMLIGSQFGPPTTAEFERALKAAKAMGSSVVRYACGPMFVWQDALPADALTSVLKEVAAITEREDMCLAIENHQDYTSEELAGVMRAVDNPRIGVWLDTGNSIAMMEDPLHTARLLAPYAHGMHLKEYVVFPNEGGFDLVGVVHGQGVIDNASVLDCVMDAAGVETLPVTVENPLERCRIPVLHPKYIAKFANAPFGMLQNVMTLIEQSREKYPDGVTLPQETDKSEAEVAAYEEEHNRTAAAFARNLLQTHGG